MTERCRTTQRELAAAGVSQLGGSLSISAQHHLDDCARCAAERARYAEAVRAWQTPTEIPELSDARSEQMLSQILAAAAAEEVPQDAQTRGVPFTGRWRRFLALGLAAPAMMAAAAVALIALRTPAPEPTQLTTLAQEGNAAVGDWRLDTAGSLAVPAKGALTLSMAPGLVVRWRGGSRGSTLQRQVESYKLELTMGAVDIRYDRPPGGLPLLIQTPRGKVHVIGTVLHVALDAEQLSVAVSRGEVEVETEASKQRLRAGESSGAAWQHLEPVVPAPAPGVVAEQSSTLVLYGEATRVRVGEREVHWLPAKLQLPAGETSLEIDSPLRGRVLHRVNLEAGRTHRLEVPPRRVVQAPATETPVADTAAAEVVAPMAQATGPGERASDRLDALYQRAERALGKGRTGDAMRILERIVRRDPKGSTGALASFELGRLHANLGQLQRAEAAYRVALQAGLPAPLTSRAQLGLCTLAVRRHAVAEARACLRLLRTAASPSTAAQGALLEAQVFCMEGDQEAAEQAFFRTRRAAPPGGTLEAQTSLARIRCAIGRGATAEAHRGLEAYRSQFGEVFAAERLELERAMGEKQPKKERKK